MVLNLITIIIKELRAQLQKRRRKSRRRMQKRKTNPKNPRKARKHPQPPKKTKKNPPKRLNRNQSPKRIRKNRPKRRRPPHPNRSKIAKCRRLRQPPWRQRPSKRNTSPPSKNGKSSLWWRCSSKRK